MHGNVRWANEHAYQKGVSPGLSYAAALSSCTDLVAGAVEDREIAESTASILELLRRFSPRVEHQPDALGVFWLELNGLERVYPSLITWAKAVRRELHRSGYQSAVAVGFQRFSTFVIVKAMHRARAIVLDNEMEEIEVVSRVPLQRIGLPTRVQDDLTHLGVATVGDFLRLPTEGLLARFGPEVHQLRCLASNEFRSSTNAVPTDDELCVAIDLDSPVASIEHILCLAVELLLPLFARLAEAGEAVANCFLCLVLEGRTQVYEHIEFAQPVVEMAQLVRLLRLRLEQVKLARAVERIELKVDGRAASADQLHLFAQRSERDCRAAEQTFTMLRAVFGDGSVVRARLVSEHLPEASFKWEPVLRLTEPRPRKVAQRPLIRRFHVETVQLPPRERREADGWMPLGPSSGPVRRLNGPYSISTGWWCEPVERHYYFAHLHNGDVLWIYYDCRIHGWFWQGTVS